MGTVDSTLVGRRDIAAVPCLFAAVAAAIIGVQTAMDGGTGLLRVLVLVASAAWTVGGLAIGYLLTTPGFAWLRARPEFYAVFVIASEASLAVVVVYDGGLTSPYVGALILGAVFFGIVLPSRSSVLAAAALAAAVLAIRLVTPETELAVFIGVVALIPIAWWTGSIGRRAHEAASRDALVLSRVDRLTASLNRRGLLEVFGHELSQAKLRGAQVAVLLFDLDDFKPINDRLGHAAGDEVLRWVGEQVGRAAGEHDQFGRLGGDEFALVMPASTADHGRAMASAVADALQPRIGVSIGVASFPIDGDSPETLLRVADGRMYQAKGGRERRAPR